MSQTRPIVLVFAANDPSGGAGIQADILTLASLGCHPLTVVTGLTVQDTIGVEAVMATSAEWVADQARCVLEDMPIAAFKLGVLGSLENAAAIADVVSDYPDVPLVFDPVLASGRGDEFGSDELIAAMREMLFPQTTVLTPNIVEARRLVQADANGMDEASETSIAQRIVRLGCEFVLVTGTHASTPAVVNTLYDEEGIVRSDTWERLPGSYHGSGCTLAAAIAAALANGLNVGDAVYDAQEYTWQALSAGFRPGMGQYIPDRMFWTRSKDKIGE